MEPFLSVYGHVAIDQICTVRKFPRDNTTEDVLTKTFDFYSRLDLPSDNECGTGHTIIQP